MKQNINLKSYILAAALSLGCVASAAAQSSEVAVPTPSTVDAGGGLIGARYLQAEYLFVDLTGSDRPNDADGFKVAINQPLNPNFDLTVDYDWAQAKYEGVRLRQQDTNVGVVAYTALEWGRPFVAASVGWQWQKAGVLEDDSFRYKIGVGSEFQVTNAFSVTPFVNFVRATGFNDNEVDVGVRAAYRVTRDWSITASAQYDSVEDDKDAAEYTVGAAYHF